MFIDLILYICKKVLLQSSVRGCVLLCVFYKYFLSVLDRMFWTDLLAFSCWSLDYKGSFSPSLVYRASRKKISEQKRIMWNWGENLAHLLAPVSHGTDFSLSLSFIVLARWNKLGKSSLVRGFNNWMGTSQITFWKYF